MIYYAFQDISVLLIAAILDLSTSVWIFQRGCHPSSHLLDQCQINGISLWRQMLSTYHIVWLLGVNPSTTQPIIALKI